MLGKAELLALLEERGLPVTCEQHETVLNMAESGKLMLSLSGARCKNLLLQDKRGRCFLVVTTASKSLDLVATAEVLRSKRLSFASADKLFDLLGVRAGSLSPFALVNDDEQRISLVIDAELAEERVFLFHPLESDTTASIARNDLDVFLASIQHQPSWVELRARETTPDWRLCRTLRLE